MICEQGDIISVNFDPRTGHEPAGRHYAVVISPWEVNMITNLTLVAPVTSRDNHHPLHVPIADGNPVRGFIQVEGLRSIDLETRDRTNLVEHVGALDDDTLDTLLAYVKAYAGLS